MRFRLAVIGICLCLLAGGVFAEEDYLKEKLVKLSIVDRTEILNLLEIDLVIEHIDLSYVVARANDQQYVELVRRGYNPLVLVEDIVANQRAMLATDDYKGYYTHAAMIAAVNALVAAHPDLVSVQQVGTTKNGRSIIMVKVSDNVGSDENEPEIYFDGNIHGDELSALEVCMYLINYLIDNYGTDATVTELVDTRELFVIPMVNPDGRESGSRYNSNGVDCNRDNGFMWGGDGGSPGPFSQAETQAIRTALDQNHFSLATSYHSGTLFFSYPWSYHYDGTPEVDEYVEIGDGYTEVNHYPVDQGSHGMYSMSGSTKDTFYGSYGALGATIEVSSQKTPPFADIAGICNNNIGGQLYMMEVAGYGIGGVVTDADTDAPIPAIIQVNDSVEDMWVSYNDQTIGDFHRFLMPGTYNVTVCANGYECYTHEGVVVLENQQTNLNTALEPSDLPNPWGYRFAYSRMPDADDATPEAWRTLGAPDGQYLSIGTGDWVVIDMGPNGIIEDETGVDIIVFEGIDASGDEGFTLYGSNTWNGPWNEIDDGRGTSDFDLNGSGLDEVRYFKIVDDGSDEDGALDGFDLDAIGGPAILVAGFTATPTSGDAPLEVDFTSNCLGNITSYLWTFGDGSTSTAENPTHTYTTADDYTVTLEVTGALGTTAETKTDYIHVIWGVPVANFAADPTSGKAPHEVDFTDFSLGSVQSWEWDFGDGETSDEADPTHIYQDPGTYSVSLTVSGPGGTDSKTKNDYITVRCPAPAADFSADPTSGDAPLEVTFTSLADGMSDCISGYAWDFGDEGNSGEENPVYLYQKPGTYTVKFTVMGDGGADLEEKEAYIEVTGETTDDDDDNDDAGGDDDDDDDDACGC